MVMFLKIKWRSLVNKIQITKSQGPDSFALPSISLVYRIAGHFDRDIISAYFSDLLRFTKITNTSIK